MTWQNIFLLALATWRMTSLLVNEPGPFGIFKRLRELAGIQHDENGEIYMIPDNLLSGILSCVWCCSVWVGGIFVLMDVLIPWADYVFLWLAISALAILVSEKSEGV